jgi:hypothetical protein
VEEDSAYLLDFFFQLTDMLVMSELQVELANQTVTLRTLCKCLCSFDVLELGCAIYHISARCDWSWMRNL